MNSINKQLSDSIEQSAPLNSPCNRIIKRAEDLVISFTILVLISPILLIIAILVKTTSKGPVLFKQNRDGLNGQVIRVWKFRSMSVMENAETVVQATKDDPRVTKIGRILRKTSLDELPQFFNVLCGSMSIVGPRPHAISHNQYYSEMITNYSARHLVKPGITGLAQARGFRGETDTLDKMQSRIDSDLEYIQTWSLWLDIKIILTTAYVVVFKEDAY